MEEMRLYEYQAEVVQPALDGRNIIIWLPTGGGKTRAAVYVAKRHLESTREAKVAVLVNKVHLVDQHFSKEFHPFLGSEYKVVPISGESAEKDFFSVVVKSSDVIICTAQILENALKSTEEEKHVKLTDFTLLIIDECHHTQKETVYNKIMGPYVEQKLTGEKNLPQVLGLTASLGTGGAKTFDGAKKHILQVCANLDASAIMSPKNHAMELQQRVPRPVKIYDIVQERLKDPFGDHVKWMMQEIHEFMDLKDVFNGFGTQEYEANVVLLEKKGVEQRNRQLAQCARHLRYYNNALLINDSVRMVDALNVLDDFYSNEKIKRIGLDATDWFLFGLFEENQTELKVLAGMTQHENPKLAQLESTLLQQFGSQAGSRGILFTKTRVSTRCLYDWILANRALQDASIKAAVLTGAGNQISHMTQNEQKQTIRRFHEGHLNLLISTSVAEEGLDNPACNLVVRYGLLTNEIAMQQASGRARAENSVYSVVASKGGREIQREKTNEYLEELTQRAIHEVQQMNPRHFQQQMGEIQKETMITQRMAGLQMRQKQNRHDPASVTLSCRTCYIAVAHGSDIQLIDDTHYINVNPTFKKYYRAGGQVHLEKSFKDWNPGRRISCAACGVEWGMEIIYKNVILPNLAIKKFALVTKDRTTTVKKWKDVPFPIQEFSYTDYCLTNFPDL
ncbi:probable ATP-dependent RNA helicase DHX58 [Brienomyrus brachyistius]|uniref:probable ATP-dependent RNA helicase DHX58 n=1 Tax=Brienomyrus brachyistius TaxID=42636 RepID=UPI0020B3C4C2|nr:probable ATP-dependent RNA helicase DHX58 [Brienomyrus brachyistius]